MFLCNLSSLFINEAQHRTHTLALGDIGEETWNTLETNQLFGDINSGDSWTPDRENLQATVLGAGSQGKMGLDHLENICNPHTSDGLAEISIYYSIFKKHNSSWVLQ